MLAAVLVFLAFATAPIARLFVDEGLAIIQVRNLAGGHGWSLPWAFADVDPTASGMAIPNHSANLVVYGKHPLYLLTLTGLYQIGGVAAMIAFSIVGTVGSALAGSWLSRLIRPGIERWVFWLIGVGTPMLFDALILVAHTVAAALVTAAVCTSVMLVRGGSRRWWLLLVPAIFLAVSWRTEALLFLGVWAVVLVGWGVVRRCGRTSAVGIGVGIAAVSSRLLDQHWAASIMGGGVSLDQAGSRAGTLDVSSRVGALLQTTAGPTSRGVTGSADLILLLATSLLFVAAVCFRRNLRVVASVCAGLYLACVLALLVTSSSGTIPGILLVFPTLVCALPLVRRRWFGDDLRLVLSISVGCFAVLVFATQYGQGGGVEWGARYLAVAIPVLSALTADVLLSQWRRVDRSTARAGLAVLVSVSVLVAALSVTVLGRIHRATSETLGPLMQQAAQVDPGDGGRPVIVTDSWALARLSWPDHDRFRWVYRAESQSRRWDERLTRVGVQAYTQVWEYGTPRAEVHRLP